MPPAIMPGTTLRPCQRFPCRRPHSSPMRSACSSSAGLGPCGSMPHAIDAFMGRDTHTHQQQDTHDANFGCSNFRSPSSNTGELHDHLGWHRHREQEPYCSQRRADTTGAGLAPQNRLPTIKPSERSNGFSASSWETRNRTGRCTREFEEVFQMRWGENRRHGCLLHVCSRICRP